MTGFTVFLVGLFSCLLVLALFLQDRHNTAVLAALARSDATTRALIRVLARRPAWEMVGAGAELVRGRDGAVYAVVRVSRNLT